MPHVSISGTNASTSDVDYYSFTVTGGYGFFDIDNGWDDVDTTLALFDSEHNLLAYGDDSGDPTDPGSLEGFDSFIGVYTFPSAGMYYIGVSNYGNGPLAYGTYEETLIRPVDSGWGGDLYSGDSGATAFSTTDGEYSSGDYTLHVSLSQPVPEPATVLLLGTGLVGLVGFRKKFKK